MHHSEVHVPNTPEYYRVFNASVLLCMLRKSRSAYCDQIGLLIPITHFHPMLRLDHGLEASYLRRYY